MQSIVNNLQEILESEKEQFTVYRMNFMQKFGLFMNVGKVKSI